MTIDPYVVQIPEVIVDPVTGRPTNEFLQWLIYDNRFKHDLFAEVTAPGVELDNVSFESSYSASLIQRALDAVYDEFSYSLNYVNSSLSTKVYTTTADFTFPGPGVLICNNTSPITVNVNPNPADGEKAIVKRRDGKVTISGSIDGGTRLTLPVRYDAPQLVYTVDAGEWSIV